MLGRTAEPGAPTAGWQLRELARQLRDLAERAENIAEDSEK